MAVRAVKGAQFAFIGAKRETLDQKKRADQAQGLGRKGQWRVGWDTIRHAFFRLCIKEVRDGE